MGLLRPRLNNGPKRHLFHSSGVVGDTDAETLGATSAESFEQRQKLESNRRLIGGYKDAGVLHNYREDALEQRSKNHAAQYKDGVAQRTPRVQGRSTNPIDIVKSPRPIGDAGQNLPSCPSFQEPTSRRYNPYK